MSRRAAAALLLIASLGGLAQAAPPGPEEDEHSAPAAREEAEDERAEPTPRPTTQGLWMDPYDGLTFTAPGVPAWVHMGGLLVADYRTYDRRNVRRSEAYLDRALIQLDATVWERIELKLSVDLRGTDTNFGLDESYASFEVVPKLLRVTGGLLRIGVGTEHSFAEETLPFVDYASPAVLTGRHDLGASVDGEAWDGLLSWALMFGGGEGFDAWGQRRGDPVVAARVMAYPLRMVDWTLDLGVYQLPVLSGLFFSVGATYTWGYEGHLDLGTSLRNKVFHIGRIHGDRSFYSHVGYGVDFGPFRLTHEFVRGSIWGVDLPTAVGEDDFENKISSWSASFAWRVTGEPYDSRAYRQRGRQRGRGDFPRAPLFGGEEEDQGFGMLEVAIRYTNTEGDRKFFDQGFTSFNLSSQEFRAFDVAVNWYPVRTVRFTFQLTRVLADQEPVAFDNRGRDTSFLVRMQLDF